MDGFERGKGECERARERERRAEVLPIAILWVMQPGFSES